jgi:hypothetical protein
MTDRPAPQEPDGQTSTVMSEIVSPTDQIGRNVMSALGDPDAVAVLTTLVPGMGTDRVVSVGLTPEQMHQVGILLQEIEAEEDEAADDEHRCIGFQCRVDKA